MAVVSFAQLAAVFYTEHYSEPTKPLIALRSDCELGAGLMPKFFLNLVEDGARIDDPEGHVFPALGSARAEAIRSAREIMAEDLRAGRPLHHGQIEICNDAGEVLEVVRFTDVLMALAD